MKTLVFFLVISVFISFRVNKKRLVRQKLNNSTHSLPRVVLGERKKIERNVGDNIFFFLTIIESAPILM